jgi:hypothetical protein
MRTIDKATAILGSELCKFNLELLTASEQGIKIDEKLYDELLFFNEASAFVKLGQRFSVELFQVHQTYKVEDMYE